jgi:hypothetical protein
VSLKDEEGVLLEIVSQLFRRVGRDLVQVRGAYLRVACLEQHALGQFLELGVRQSPCREPWICGVHRLRRRYRRGEQ